MELRGTVREIIYENEDTGYVVAKLKTENETVTFTGNIPYVFEGQLLMLMGEMVLHPTFGTQMKVSYAEEIMPDSIEGIEKYLSSGVISGIGPVTAKRIIKKFGKEVFNIMDNDIERLLEVEGIGTKKLNIIIASYNKTREVRNIMVFLQSYGVTPSQCLKIYYRYGHDSIRVVSENPYILSEQIPTFGFKTADRIAERLGIDRNSPFRIESGIKYVMGSYSSSGHTCMDLDTLINDTSELLEVESHEILNSVKTLIIDEKLVSEFIDDKQFIFTPLYHSCESAIAKNMLNLKSCNFRKIKRDVEAFIESYEEKNGIRLHEKQKDAIMSVKDEGVLVITGGPGTGKTTIIKCILELLKSEGLKVLMGAPTGRAAKRMKETTGEEAKTIHRMLDLPVTDDMDEENDSEQALDCDCVIVDEASMIDVILMNSLMKSLKGGTRLILVGDVDQLPSVGPGKVLSDIIESESVRTVRLEMIFRQGKESMITLNAHRINNGEMPVFNTKDSDFFIISNNDRLKCRDEIVELVKKRLPSFQELDPVKDIQVLSPMRKGELGINELNELLSEALNSERKSSRKLKGFSLGDKVMQTRNNYQLKSRDTLIKEDDTYEEETGVFNGDIGFVCAIDNEEEKLTVLYDDRFVDYTPVDMEDLELAYAITVHKSQGSEFKAVVIPLYMGPPLLMNRNLLYTGVTRGKKLVVLIGDTRALSYMIRNNRSFKRNTSLGIRLKRLTGDSEV